MGTRRLLRSARRWGRQRPNPPRSVKQRRSRPHRRRRWNHRPADTDRSAVRQRAVESTGEKFIFHIWILGPGLYIRYISESRAGVTVPVSNSPAAIQRGLAGGVTGHDFIRMKTSSRSRVVARERSVCRLPLDDTPDASSAGASSFIVPDAGRWPAFLPAFSVCVDATCLNP
jgi:hypothetical protein